MCDVLYYLFVLEWNRFWEECGVRKDKHRSIGYMIALVNVRAKPINPSYSKKRLRCWP